MLVELRVAQEQWTLDQFMHGLNNRQLKQHMQFGHARDINQAISLAIEFEAFQQTNIDRFKKPRMGEINAIEKSFSPQFTSSENIHKKDVPYQGGNTKLNYCSRQNTNTETREFFFCKKIIVFC